MSILKLIDGPGIPVLIRPATNRPAPAPRYPFFNRLFRKACAKYPNTEYIPAWEWTSIGGKFFPIMKNKQGGSGRFKYAGDPIHHTHFGGMVLVDLFPNHIQKACGLDLEGKDQ